jgi:hypothetical protein
VSQQPFPAIIFFFIIYQCLGSYSAFDCFDQVIYKIKLPGPAILGEGKPENQNHAIMFTRGEGLQTIDMNQVILV